MGATLSKTWICSCDACVALAAKPRIRGASRDEALFDAARRARRRRRSYIGRIRTCPFFSLALANALGLPIWTLLDHQLAPEEILAHRLLRQRQRFFRDGVGFAGA